jgi:hypothetical protein
MADRAEQVQVLDRLAQLCLLGLGVVTVLLQLSQTEAFETHFFFDSDATLTDVLTLSPKLNTAGRREALPALLKACSDATYQRRRAQGRARAAARIPRTLAASPTGYGTSFTERRN